MAQSTVRLPGVDGLNLRDRQHPGVIGIVVSRADIASVHIGEQLQSIGEFEQVEEGVYRRPGFELREFELLHLELDDVASALDQLGVNHTERKSHSGKSAKEIYCSSSEFVTWLENLEPAILGSSAGQRVPDAVMEASAETKIEFLRAYVDSGGHVAATAETTQVYVDPEAGTSRPLPEAWVGKMEAYRSRS